MFFAAALTALPAWAQNIDDLPNLGFVNNRGIVGVRAVYAHPNDPNVAWLTTNDGLLKTSDAGATFSAVESASVEAIGTITSLVCCPADDSRLAAGTSDRGLFLSADGGKTWRHAGSESEKLAAEQVEFVDFCDSDPSYQTLYVSHGTAATGLSVTRDLGKSWDVIGNDRFFRGFVKDGDTIIAIGALASSDGKVWSIDRSPYEGLRWEEAQRDVRPTEVGRSLGRNVHFVCGTSDGELYESGDDGESWNRVARVSGSSWVSVFFTHGRTEAAEVLAGYDPRVKGLVLSLRRFRQGSLSERGKGLYIGPFVKSGSMCRANANGSVYYVVLNNGLWLGRRAPAKTGPVVSQAWCSPAQAWIRANAASSAEWALHNAVEKVAEGYAVQTDATAIASAARGVAKSKADLAFTLRGRVEHPDGAKAVKIVTADLSSLGGGRAEELFDDGKHGDGQAGDGLWAREFRFAAASLDGQSERRSRLPGKLALNVTAIDVGGASNHWTAALGVYYQSETFSIWPGLTHYWRFPNELTEGDVNVQENTHDAYVSDKGRCWAIHATGPGPWRGGWLLGGGGNMAGRTKLTFYIKGDVDQDINVQLADQFQQGEDVIDQPHFSKAVPLISGGYLKAITRDYQKVTIPMKELLPRDVFFLRRHTAGFVLATGESGKPGRYFVDHIQAEP